jgi:hypothetical protein
MEYIKVKWIKAHPAFAYSAGNIGSVTDKNAAMLLNGGFIIILPEEEEEKTNPLPDDLPGRGPLFASGFDNLEKIKEAGDSILDTGISNATLKKVKKYLESL